MNRRGIKSTAILLFALTTASCNNSNQDDPESAPVPEQVQHTDTSNTLCDTLLSQLIRSTSIADEDKELKIECERRRDSSLSVRLYHVDDNSIKTVAVTLTINSRKRGLYNLSERVGPPILLRCDTAILSEVIAHCMQ